VLPFDFSGLLAPLLLGTLVGFIVGLVPGIGGRIGILLCLPIAVSWGPLGGAVFLFSMHAVIHTSSSIPTIAFGLPTSGADAATVLDGHPLALRGQAGRALGASLSASVLGGAIGAVAFVACIPVARAILGWFGPPEFLLLALLGLIVIPLLSGNLITGLISAALGLLAACVGMDVLTGTSRFTFGSPRLLDGLDLAAVVGGLFVIPEMLARRESDEASSRNALATKLSDVISGIRETFRHLRLVVVSSLYGIVIGIMPGVGASVSVWLSYAYAVRNVPSDVPYGEGAIPGVIAPETANNAKEGGAMIPTLFFGIPGSSSMAIMLAALTVIGQPVGPQLLTSDIGTALILAATVLLANLVAIPMFLATVPALVRLAALRRGHLVPIAISLSLFSALYQDLQYITLLQFVLGALLGLLLGMIGWSRVAFLLGFVMGPLAEISYIQSVQIWGWEMFTRPAFLIMLAGFLVLAFRARGKRSRHASLPLSRHDSCLAVGVLPVFAWAAAAAYALPPNASPMPLIIAVFGALLSMIVAVLPLLGSRSTHGELQAYEHVPTVAMYFLGVPVLGVPIASGILTAVMIYRAKAPAGAALLCGLTIAGIQLAFFALVAHPSYEPLVAGILAAKFH
jgi:putative tricarboxylic transport membrane protein